MLSTMFRSLLFFRSHLHITKIYIINVERTDYFVERTDYFWNNPTWNDLTMEQNDRKPTDRMRVMSSENCNFYESYWWNGRS